MWKPSGASLPSVLIVQNKSGNVFIIDNSNEESQVDKILKKDLNIEGSSKKPEIKVKIKSREPSPIPIR